MFGFLFGHSGTVESEDGSYSYTVEEKEGTKNIRANNEKSRKLIDRWWNSRDDDDDDDDEDEE